MNEIYLGSSADREYISTYLENIRKVDPIEIVTVNAPINLSEDGRISDFIRVEQFWAVVNDFFALFERTYGIKLTQVHPERYYTALPAPDALGGFHDPNSLGYQYWYQGSFVVLLNPRRISKRLRTIEFARDFLHDSLHHSTFRSFRRAVRTPAVSPQIAKHRIPEIYMEQYGVNFRDMDGTSYSSTEMTLRSPETINLNLLMDGVVVLIVAELMKQLVNRSVPLETEEEIEVVKEILLDPFSETLSSRATHFSTAVTEPSRKFVEHWGGEDFIAILLRAMMSGNLAEIKQFFRNETGLEDAWEKMFMRPGFALSPLTGE